MSTSGRTATADAAGDLTDAIREAGFVHLVAAATGDALAAVGLLVRGCRAADVPFQASVVRTDTERDRRMADVESERSRHSNNERRGLGNDELAVLVADSRSPADHVVSAREHPASVTAHAVATGLGAEPATTLALAGAFSAGVRPGAGATAGLLEAAEESGAVERRPGVALPVADVAEGLTHQTLVHADFAADADRAAELAREAGLDPDGAADDDTADADRQRLASLVALDTAGDERAGPRAADALERALRPYVTHDGPFATVGGYADVLEATARVAPGIGVALALDGPAVDDPAPGSGIRTRALEVWRDHGRAAHAAVRAAATSRSDGLIVACIERDGGVDGDLAVETVARLILDARSTEQVVLVVGDGEAGAAAAPGADVHVGEAMRETVATIGGESGGDRGRAYARHDAKLDEFETAFREVES